MRDAALGGLIVGVDVIDAALKGLVVVVVATALALEVLMVEIKICQMWTLPNTSIAPITTE